MQWPVINERLPALPINLHAVAHLATTIVRVTRRSYTPRAHSTIIRRVRAVHLRHPPVRGEARYRLVAWAATPIQAARAPVCESSSEPRSLLHEVSGHGY